MRWYEHSAETIENLAKTDLNAGLTDKEAEARLAEHGANELDEQERPSALLVFLEQFKDFMVVVLLAATLISGLLGEYIDAITIMLIVLINGILGFVQERKAEKSLEALKELSAPQMTVLRDGVWRRIPAKEVVFGDVVRFESGDRIGADVRLVRSSELSVEESALTGESVAVDKRVEAIVGDDLAVGDQENMTFMGTMVARGSGVGVVIGTGMETEMGKIADLLQREDTLMTPLQRRLEQLGRILITASLGLTALVVVIGVLQGQDIYKMFLAGVSLAVAAIPEGLPAIVTVALALGVQRMIKKRALVRRLPSVETLGCATVICSDKTGTLTQNQMTVTRLWNGGKTWEVTGSGYEPVGEFYENRRKINVDDRKSLKQLLTFGMLCNNAEITKRKKEYMVNGDPTEGALATAAIKAGLTKEALARDFRVAREFPFDSARKMMTVIIEGRNGERFAVTKGAPDVVLTRSRDLLWLDKQERMSKTYKDRINAEIQTMGKGALRTIAVAFRPLKKGETFQSNNEVERNLTFIGLQGMIDPPRDEVKEAIRECQEAGIRTVMITGDHAVTATAIAKELKMLPEGGQVMDGRTLGKLSVSELGEIIDNVYVFARVSPEHKLKIVKALQQQGHVVAMTGDGVNDAPAIKVSNIGISMGRTGTDVAKESSSLILSDDNFSTIRAAIKEGRNIYENIRKFIRYLLASNVGEILSMFFAMLLALPLPLVPIQILWVNLVTDGLPAMALGMDAPERDLMKRPPRPQNEGVFARGLGWKIISRGFLVGASTLAVFLIVLHSAPNNLTAAQTAAFSTLVMAQLIHVFDCRCEHSIFERNFLGNLYLIGAVLSSVLLLLLVIYYEPLQGIFRTTPLTASGWGLVLVFAAVPTFLPAVLKIPSRR
ncbi:MAG TPA: calcium-translocating P-type ATPase, SERCA-type [Bacillales bacterium]|nr:calcium-translocating P-type ATPase, SERCA-type [Bacillales bacterium]